MIIEGEPLRARGCFIAAALLSTVLASSLSGFQAVFAIPSTNMIDVPYYVQEKSYYCGPASVQMVIEYLSGDIIPQQVLATEMKTDPVKRVTFANKMNLSFVGRGYESVRERKNSTIDELREQNSRGYVSILLIWSDTGLKTGHYVVVAGYNETGIFVNDPWPSDWRQPKSRKTGKNAFIPDSILADLWTCYDQWILEIPYRPRPPIELVSRTFNPREDQPILIGETLTITCELRNAGKTTLKAVWVYVEIFSKDVTMIELTPPKSLSPGAIEKFVIKIQFDNEGDYKGTMCAYVDGVPAEEMPLTIQVSSWPIWRSPVITGGIIALIAAALAIAILITRRKTERPKSTTSFSNFPAPPKPFPQFSLYSSILPLRAGPSWREAFPPRDHCN